MILRILLLSTIALGAGAAPPEQPPPDPVETGAWLKLLNLGSGAPEPVLLSQPEANALLASDALAPFAESVGLSRASVRFTPGEVHVSGLMTPSALEGVAVPVPPGAAGQPVELVVAVEGEAGQAQARVVRGAVAGVELPPALLEEAVLGIVFAAVGAAPDPGGGFALPAAVGGLEVVAGGLRLTPR